MKTKANITKIIRISLSICLTAFCIFHLCSCSFSEDYDEFDENTEGIVDVKTIVDYYGDNKENSYYSLAAGNRIKVIKPFDGDEIEIYTADSSCFEAYIDRKKNKVLNKLVEESLTDKHDNEVKITPVLKDMFKQISKLEHDLMVVQILKDGDEYFAYVELNVNLWTPCTLYYYNKDTSELVELYEFDNERVTDLKIRNLDLIK